MVRISSFALAGLAAVGTSAFPREHKRNIDVSVGSGGQQCMTADQAQFVASNYGTLIANYTNELADLTLSVNFTDYAESVNSLINGCPQGAAAVSLPLLSPTFTSRQMFEIGQGQQAPINFQQLNIWPACDTVIIRWETTNTAPIPNPRPVVGLIAMEVVPNTNATTQAQYPWLIDYVYSEFDAAAWLQNLIDAGFCPTANSTCSASSTATATATDAPSSTATASAGSGSGAVCAALPSTTDTDTDTVTVNPDGTTAEEPCEEEEEEN